MNEEVLDNVRANSISYRIIKRLTDIIFGIIGVIIFIPLLIIVKICYMLTGDFKRVIFTQDRIGKNGKNFKLYKFRSMVPNSD